MTQIEFEKEQRRIRDRARRSEMQKKKDQLKFQAEMLCDPHINDQELLNRMLKTLIAALKLYQLDEDQKQLLVEHMREAGREMPTVSRSGNIISLNGMFDIRKLAQRMVWQGVYTEPMRGIGEEEENEL